MGFQAPSGFSFLCAIGQTKRRSLPYSGKRFYLCPAYAQPFLALILLSDPAEAEGKVNLPAHVDQVFRMRARPPAVVASDSHLLL